MPRGVWAETSNAPGGPDPPPDHEATSRSDIRRLLRGGSVNLIGGMSNAGLTLGFTLLITRQLGASGAGTFFQAVGIFSILIVACQLGAGAMIVRTISAYRAVGRSRDAAASIRIAIVPVAAVSVLTGAALFAFARPLSHVLVREGSRHDLEVYLRIFALFIPLAVLYAVAIAATRGFGKMLPTVLLDSIGIPAFRFAFAGLGVLIALSPLATGALWAAPVGAALLLSVVMLRRLLVRSSIQEVHSDGPHTPSRYLFREFWALTVPQWLTDVFQLAVVWIDVVLLGALASSREAGIYAAVSKLAGAGAIASVALSLVLGPMLGALLARNEIARVQRLYHTATKWLAVASMPVFLVVAAFAPLLAGIFGAGFRTGSTALRIIALALLLWGLSGIAQLTLRMGGQTRVIMWDAAAALVANIGLNAVLIPVFSMNGAAIAWAASILLINTVAMVQMHRMWGIRPFDRPFFSVAGSAVLCFGVGGTLAASLGGQTISALLLSTVIETLIFAAYLWRFKERLELSLL